MNHIWLYYNKILISAMDNITLQYAGASPGVQIL